MATRPAVVIAGGGPVGLVVALMLGRAGIAVTLFDQGDIVHSQPRAATIHPATLDLLDDLGAYALIEPQGITIRGFAGPEYMHLQGEFSERMADWVKTGKIKYRETVLDGIANAPAAMIGLMRGENLGKMLVKLA